MSIGAFSFNGFDWDAHNLEKCQSHGLSVDMIESLFDRAVAIERDPFEHESRFRAIAKTAEGRSVFIVFTLRDRGGRVLIRPISARYMHQREVDAYATQKDPDVQD
jgi:uncharacterized DUF497 family protein